MKKFCITLLLGLFGIVSLSAQSSFTPQQLSLRSNIYQYLRTEGYVPEIDSDGDIKFKKEGDTFFVSVSKSDTSPYYVSLLSYYNYEKALSKEKIAAALEELNLWKGVKVVLFSDSFAIQGSMFVNNAEAFTSVMPKLFSIMRSVEQELAEL